MRLNETRNATDRTYSITNTASLQVRLVVRDRIELSTFRFSGGRSYQLSYLTWLDVR